MSASNPNTVTVVNQLGQPVSKLYLGHVAATFVAPTAKMSGVLGISNLAAGATSQAGTAKVAKDLADFWFMVLELEDASLWFLVATVIAVPYKKCDTPDNGTTVFTLMPVAGDKLPVNIDTFEQDGSSDGSCIAWMVGASGVGDGFDQLLKVLEEALDLIDAVEKTPASGEG